MQYNFNGKTLRIPDAEIENSMKLLELTKEEAIQLWLEDNDYLENEEQTQLNEKANAVKVDHGVKGNGVGKKKGTPHNVTVSDEKQQLFNEIKDFLTEKYGNCEILTNNKLLSVKIGEKTLKIDLIQQRKAKK